MSKIEDGGPAFPFACQGPTTAPEAYYGMTLRQYAAIKLRVPNSGTDWLDEIISKSMRDEFAAKVMQGMYNDGSVVAASKLVDDSTNMNAVASWAYAQADAMLRASKESQ